MVGALGPAESRSPQGRREDEHRQKEEDADDLKPNLATDFTERAKEAVDASGYSAGGLTCRSAPCCWIGG
jgi:hypothetical protein